MSCKKAIGVAEEMKEKYGDSLQLKVYTTDSKEAEPYRFKSSTNVVFESELVPLEIAINRDRMDAFVSSKL
ncbi:MAG: HSGNP motif-containing (seleno)protein [Syntrophobacteraceae bacterium]